MSVYAKQLHYIKDGAQNDIQLYTSLSDVVDVNINPDGTTGGITLYTSPQDVGYQNPTLSLYTSPDDAGYPCARLMDGDTPVYVALEELTSNNANVSGLRMSAGGNTYVVRKEALPAKGKSSYTPAEIKEILNAGKHTDYFNVGDSMFQITLNGTVEDETYDNYVVYATILGFDHNKALESDGKSSIHFIIGRNSGGLDITLCHFTEAGGWGERTNAKGFRMNRTDGNIGGWVSSYMRTRVLPQLMSALPREWRDTMSEIKKMSDNIGGANYGSLTQTNEKLFLPSAYEIGGSTGRGNPNEASYQERYTYYASGFSAVRIGNKNSSAVTWWTRSPSTNRNSTEYWEMIQADGSVYSDTSSYDCGISPCFAIVAD